MVYEYNSKIVNQNKVDDFFNDKNFVGYILPDGTIFKCKDHNVSDANSFLWMYLMLLDEDYDNKEELLGTPTNNKLLKIIANRLRMMSHDEIHALYMYANENQVFFLLFFIHIFKL